MCDRSECLSFSVRIIKAPIYSEKFREMAITSTIRGATDIHMFVVSITRAR